MVDAVSAGTTSAPPSALIASDRIDAIKVFGRDGSRIGVVNTFVLDKNRGQVVLVIVSSGGFLGLGQAYHPLPWAAFSFDEERGGYVVLLDKAMLDGGPTFRPDSRPTFEEGYVLRVNEYYRPMIGA